MLVGVGQEGADGLRIDAAAADLVVDVLHIHLLDAQALGRAAIQQRLDRAGQRGVDDGDVVGAVGRRQQLGGRVPFHCQRRQQGGVGGEKIAGRGCAGRPLVPEVEAPLAARGVGHRRGQLHRMTGVTHVVDAHAGDAEALGAHAGPLAAHRDRLDVEPVVASLDRSRVGDFDPVRRDPVVGHPRQLGQRRLQRDAVGRLIQPGGGDVAVAR